MTRAELRTLILEWLDDVNAGYFTTATVNTWINNAQREVQKKLLEAGDNYYLETVQTSTVASQADYVIPDDFVKLHRLELILSGTGVNENRLQLNPITLNQQFDYGNGLGTPIAYALKKNRLTLFPTPDQVYTLRLYYSPRVADMNSDSDIPDVPEDYQELIAIEAAFNGFIKDDRSPAVLIDKQAKYIQQLKQTSEDRKQDRSRRVIETDDVDGFMAVF